MSPSRRQLIAKSLLVVISISLALLTLEGGLRAWFALKGKDIAQYRPSFFNLNTANQDRSRFTSHPFLPYAPRPFDARKLSTVSADTGKAFDCDYTTNSLGFRTPDRPFKKPAMTRRVITLGGSTTFGGPTDGETWPALLEKRLNDRYAKQGYKIEVINLAVDMAGSAYSLIDLAFIGVEYEPDLVISYDGVNDTWILGYEGLMPDYRSLMDRFDEKQRPLQAKLPRWAFHSYLLTWASFRLDRMGGNSPDLLTQVVARKLSRLKPAADPLTGVEYFERNLRLMRAISTEYGAKFLAATAHWVHPSDKVNSLNQNLRQFYDKEHIDFLDLDRAIPHDDWSLHVDEVHWSLQGQQLMAQHWEAKIVAVDGLGLGAAQSP